MGSFRTTLRLTFAVECVVVGSMEVTEVSEMSAFERSPRARASPPRPPPRSFSSREVTAGAMVRLRLTSRSPAVPWRPACLKSTFFWLFPGAGDFEAAVEDAAKVDAGDLCTLAHTLYPAASEVRSSFPSVPVRENQSWLLDGCALLLW